MRLLPDVSQSKRPMLLAIGIRVVCGRRRGLPNPRFAQERSDKKSLGRQEVFRRCRERQTSWDGRVGPRCTNETDASRPKRPTCRVGIKIKEVCRRRRGLPDARAQRLSHLLQGIKRCSQSVVTKRNRCLAEETIGCLTSHDQRGARHLRNWPEESFTRQMPGEEEIT
jgi:hypothetical protein